MLRIHFMFLIFFTLVAGFSTQTSFAQTIPSKTFGVDLLWEAVGAHTPPFYKGKALPASQADIKMVAIPHLAALSGEELNIEDLVYKWQRNYKYRDFNNQSGYGIYSVGFRKDLLRNAEVIGVEVSSSGGSLRANERVTIGTHDPFVVFYEKHPLEGVRYEHAIDETFHMENQEALIAAEPYFFSVNDKNGSRISYDWRINNEKVEDTESDKKSELALRTQGGSGSAMVSLEIKHADKILQFMKKSFTVQFGEEILPGFGF